jgi:hypothetical protein
VAAAGSDVEPQPSWFRRRSLCAFADAHAACLRAMYVERISALEALTPSDEPAGEYVAAAAISRNGFARDGRELRAQSGRTIKVWGFVDHANLYGDAAARETLGEWWSGDGPSAGSWRFNLKARAEDGPGQSFPVYVRTDQGTVALLRAFVANARAPRPTKVYVTGRLFTFDAPANTVARTGLYLDVQSSNAVLIAPPE